MLFAFDWVSTIFFLVGASLSVIYIEICLRTRILNDVLYVFRDVYAVQWLNLTASLKSVGRLDQFQCRLRDGRFDFNSVVAGVLRELRLWLLSGLWSKRFLVFYLVIIVKKGKKQRLITLLQSYIYAFMLRGSSKA